MHVKSLAPPLDWLSTKIVDMKLLTPKRDGKSSRMDLGDCLCFDDRSISPDSKNPATVLEPRFICYQHPAPQEHPTTGWPSLTPSDVLELQSIVPNPHSSNDYVHADDNGLSNKKRRASVVQLIKKKLSQTSTTLKLSPSRRDAKDATAKDRVELLADPLLSNYDLDAIPFEAEVRIVSDQVRSPEVATSASPRQAQRGSIRSEETLIPSASVSESTPLISSPPHAPILHTNQNAVDYEGNRPRGAEAFQHEFAVSQGDSDEEYQLSRMSFEDKRDNFRERTASRMSEIADRYSTPGPETCDELVGSEHAAAEANDKEDSDDRLLSRGPQEAPHSKIMTYLQTSSEYTEREPISMSAMTSVDSVEAAHDNARVYRSLLQNPRLKLEPPQRNPSNASIHLQNMRISQHLRPFSGLSLESDEPEHLRSSSGFQSVTMPASWGNILDSANPKPEPTRENIPVLRPLALESKVPNISHTTSINGRLRSRIPEIGVDGPPDRYSEDRDEGISLAAPSAYSAASVGTNYEATASMWEKALATHQEEILNPSRKRGTSFSSISRRPSRQSRQSSEAPRRSGEDAADRPSQAPSISVTPFALKRINTSLSFDKLAMPNMNLSTSQPGSPNIANVEARRASDRLTVAGRQRSVSLPPTSDLEPSEQPRRSQLLVGGTESGISVPDIILSEPAHEVTPLRKYNSAGPFDHLPPSQRPWARFPNMNRETRNSSASVLTGDDVIVRDFQPVSQEPLSPGGSLSKIDQLKRRERAKLRATAIMIKRKLLHDLPSAWKPSNATFRRREHGHRSSIIMGGALEYPELELLPSSVPRLPTAIDQSRTMFQTRSRGRQLISESSNYDPIKAPSQAQSELGSDRRTSSFLASQYQQHISEWSNKRNSESVSPLDGNRDSAHFNVSPGSKSLPGRDWARTVRMNSFILNRSQSHQALG